MNKFQEIFSFAHSTVWKVLFGKVADSIEKGTEHEDEYMISEKELLVNSLEPFACNGCKTRFTLNPLMLVLINHPLVILDIDVVYSIREAAANNLKRFAEEFGPEWAMQHLVPQVLDMVTNPHYLHRMMVLRAISLMAPVMGSEITCSKFLPVVAEASKDRVPNVKFNVAKLLQSLIPIVDQSCLVDLSEDPDVDVRYFANQALRSIDDAAAAQS
ncbi:hypothetical protein YC2023_093179 [Brassica napus]